LRKKNVAIKKLLFIWVILILFFGGIYTKSSNKKRVIQAIKADQPIKVDGLLGEKVWNGKGTTGFVQSDPVDGAAPTEKTEVWVAYDEKALYIAARMYDSEPEKIIGLLGRRDDFVDSDWFIFSVDPYFDRRSGYQFAVNPAGSIVDWTLFNDESTDQTWDGVWDSATKVDEKGWTVEIRIPFHQLRFKKKEKYTWGVNFRRLIKRKNERAGLVWVPKEESGYVSRFARLEGIQNIKPGRNIELVPFTASKAAFSSEQEEGNPFATGENYHVNAGLDMKIGLKSNLTLDMTINPDFGQVEVDPAVINLSASENYYSEKRPFFIEGANIFRFGRGGSNRQIAANWGNPSFFYSRRIGRPPQGDVDTDGYVRYPDWTTIISAAKITGKVGNGWNVGFLSAVTEREYAKVDLEGDRSTQEVEPLAYYGVFRAQKEFNQGRQGLGFISTSVVRDLRTEGLKDNLNRNAFGFGVDGWTFLDKDKTWVVTGWLGGTMVSGSETAISNLQQSYLHYYQRPDANYVELDENATSLNGWAGRFTLNKQKGNFVFNAAVGAVSPGFDSSDMGFQWNSDVINFHVMAGYNSFHPGKIFRSWAVNLFTQRNYDFGGNKVGEQRLIFIAHVEWLNYWETYMQISYNPGHWSKELTRGGPMTKEPGFTWGDFGTHTDNRKPLVLSVDAGFFSGKSGSHSWSAHLGLRWKPKSNFSLRISPSYNFRHSAAQWVTNVDDFLMTETYGTRYVFSEIDQKTLSCSIRINWIFTPKLSLQGYIQPFIAVGDYGKFKELARARSFDFNNFGENGSIVGLEDDIYTIDPDGPGEALPFTFDQPDFNYKSLRGTIVLRWEYRPGSTLYAVWTQNRADYSDPGELKFGRDFSNLLSAPGDNIFMLKFTYRFKM
jgi:hypothetical protein